MSKPFHFLGIPGRVFFKFAMEKSEKVYYGGCGDRTHDPKTHGPADDVICEGISRVLVRLTTCNWLTNSLPKLSLITWFQNRRFRQRMNGWGGYRRTTRF